MRVTDERVPTGHAGRCFTALAALGGRASSTQIRLYSGCAPGGQMTTVQVRTSLHALSRRKDPLAGIAEPGHAGYGHPAVWQLTAAGRDLWARTRPGGGHGA
jgi:hypothetical protein